VRPKPRWCSCLSGSAGAFVPQKTRVRGGLWPGRCMTAETLLVAQRQLVPLRGGPARHTPGPSRARTP